MGGTALLSTVSSHTLVECMGFFIADPRNVVFRLSPDAGRDASRVRLHLPYSVHEKGGRS